MGYPAGPNTEQRTVGDRSRSVQQGLIVVDLHCSRSARAADIQAGPDIAVNVRFISVRLSIRAQKDSVLFVQCRE